MSSPGVASAGVYNGMRQIGGVLGAAGIAVAMQARLVAHVPRMSSAGSNGVLGALPAMVRGAFGTAMGESLLVPGVVVATNTPLGHPEDHSNGAIVSRP